MQITRGENPRKKRSCGFHMNVVGMFNSFSASKHVAGEEGLEPSHAGIKIRCLYQLGDSPTQAV
jgi:hypothetical protein